MKAQLTEQDIADLISAAGVFEDNDIGGFVYTIRERMLSDGLHDGSSWDHPQVKAWGEASVTLKRLRKEGKI